MQHVCAADQRANDSVKTQLNEIIKKDTAFQSVFSKFDSKENLKKKLVYKPKLERNYYIFRIFGKEKVDHFKARLIAYGNNHLPLFSRRYYFRVIEKSYTYPILFLFILLILFFIANILGVIYTLYLTSKSKNHNDRYIAVFTSLYEDVLRSYLFGELDWETARIKLKRIKKHKNRQILINVLFNFQENLRGGIDNRVSQVFIDLGLHHDAWKLAKTKPFYNRIKAIRELTSLYPERAHAVVRYFLNAKDDIVRDEAQKSYLKLNPQKPFGFFKDLTSPFTRWTQLSAFHLLRLHQIEVPHFINYIKTEHMNIQNFCLRMIIYFQQLDHITEIYALANSKHEMTRYLCIKATHDLRIEEGRAVIKALYPDETFKNRIEILRALRNIGHQEDYDFLETIIKTGSISEKTEACRTMYFMNHDSREHLEQLKEDENLEIDKFIAHVSDLRN